MIPRTIVPRYRAVILGSALLLAGCGDQPAGRAEGSNDLAADTGASQQPASAAKSADASMPQASPAPAEQAGPALAVEGEGLRLFDRESGSARAIPFGTAEAQTLAALAFRGPPGTGINADCGVRYASWPDGLTLYFQRGLFAGWALDGRAEDALGTAANVGPGASRAELEDAHAATFRQSTLGTEFTFGDVAGVLDGSGADARITNMWAGAACVAR